MNTLIVATRKALLLYRRSDTGWQLERQAHPGIPCTYAFCDARNQTLWAALDHGHWGQKLHRSRDRGATWEEIAAPKYPEGEKAHVYGGETKAASLEYIWVMATGGLDEPERLYIGTNPGGLFTSVDGGDSWSLVEGLWNHPSRMLWFGGGRDTPGIHSIMVDPRDSSRVQVGISCAGVFETRDGGENWRPQNEGVRCDFLPQDQAKVGHDPHFVAACPSHPDVLWQQNHCGIFRSTDGGETWSDCAPLGTVPFFGFPVAVSQDNPDTAWVVPAISDEVRMAVDGRMRVCRTDDGGKTWREQTAGLPQERCFDLVFRHAMDLTGTTLAMGSTCGNLWISEDGGDQWQVLEHHLAPIYSVRFAP
jgi:photosystem II stability/assembly factor-like uncharacterized protein